MSNWNQYFFNVYSTFYQNCNFQHDCSKLQIFGYVATDDSTRQSSISSRYCQLVDIAKSHASYQKHGPFCFCKNSALRIAKTIVKHNPANPNENTDRRIDWQIDGRKFGQADRQSDRLADEPDNPAIELSNEAKKLNTADIPFCTVCIHLFIHCHTSSPEHLSQLQTLL